MAYQIQSALISILSRQIGISHSNSFNALFNEFDRQNFLIGLQSSGEKKQMIFSLIFLGYNNYYPQQGQQPIQQEVTTQQNGNAKAATTKIPRVISGNTEKVSRKGELAPQDPDVDLEYQNFLLKDLKPEDFVMETPLAAYFTLVIGKLFSYCM